MLGSMFAGQRVLVAGAGVSGRSVADALVGLGAEVTVTDADVDRLTEVNVAARTRVAIEEPPPGTGLVVISPGWHLDSPLLVAAAEAGIEVIGEVELAWRLAERPTWLAVAGTNGKTTTVGMLEAILRAAGVDAVGCGTAERSVLDAVLAGHEVLAVELTGFQLRWQSSLRPKASVLLNVAEETEDDLAKVYTHTETAVFNA